MWPLGKYKGGTKYMPNGNFRREKFVALVSVWGVFAYPALGLAYDLSRSKSAISGFFVWLTCLGVWFLGFRFLAHRAGWWTMQRRWWFGQSRATASYFTRAGQEWAVYALFCSDPRWRWVTQNIISATFNVSREAVAAVVNFGGPAKLVYGDQAVVADMLADIRLAHQNGVQDFVLIMHTEVCKALKNRGVTFTDLSAEIAGSNEILNQAIVKVRTAVPLARVWGAVLVPGKRGLFSFLGRTMRLEWIEGSHP